MPLASDFLAADAGALEMGRARGDSRNHTCPCCVHRCTQQRDLKKSRQVPPGFAWRSTAVEKRDFARARQTRSDSLARLQSLETPAKRPTRSGESPATSSDSRTSVNTSVSVKSVHIIFDEAVN